MIELAMYIGGVILVLIVLLGVGYKSERNVNFSQKTIFGFGYLLATNPRFISSLTYVRRDANAGFACKRGRWYIQAPNWFNKYVYNFGARERLKPLPKIEP